MSEEKKNRKFEMTVGKKDNIHLNSGYRVIALSSCNVPTVWYYSGDFAGARRLAVHLCWHRDQAVEICKLVGTIVRDDPPLKYVEAESSKGEEFPEEEEQRRQMRKTSPVPSAQ